MRRVTPVVAATMLLVLAAAALGGVQLLLLDLPLAGLAVCLVGVAVVVLTWKLQVTASTAKDVQRRLKLLAHQLDRPVPAPPKPAPAPPAEPVRTVAEKLTEVGTFTAERSVATDSTGRVAAATTTDADAPFRLFAATNGMGAPEVSPVTRNAIALVGSDALAAHLAAHGTVHRLHPSMSAAELEYSRPTSLVIEEDSLASGPWAGALDPHGASLLLELRVAMAWMRRNTGSIYVLPATGIRGVAADALRADTNVIDEALVEAQGPDPAPSLLTGLHAYRLQGDAS
ncbi:hypothetical protein GCM10028820_07480 [Tessaracoccus terricola]